MLKLFQKLFCKHQYKFSFSFLVETGMKKVVVHRCTKCGKIKVYIV